MKDDWEWSFLTLYTYLKKGMEKITLLDYTVDSRVEKLGLLIVNVSIDRHFTFDLALLSP